ncbi:hypothetical protein TON_1079 [Thermococcus onnurineus NA1]|uniref:Uncharacterized protein n=2 Tax=Thermococcus TaxID=2263 RepID=B6YWV4_THEON|nr:hypothetical protein [Thermococcus onnurineus]ACJ16567.1 hypothetical protein TON_1079 [Thermococcus onnurineus NA1]
MVWRDKVFWGLAGMALIAYLYGLLVDFDAMIIGHVLWILAFVYLLVSSIEKWAK